MRDPGPVKAGSPEHRAILEFAHFLAQRFEMSETAALGHLIHFDDEIRKAVQHPRGMASLTIKTESE